jgi:hypothetical protein
MAASASWLRGRIRLPVPMSLSPQNKRRYTKVIKELGIIGLGNALCGLHVRVEALVPIAASRSCIV